MTCTGTVGNPPGNLHWCYKRYGLDADFIEYPSEMDVTWENVTQVPETKMFSSSDEFTLIGPTSVASTVI
jgi:hypothetical protein